MQIKKNQGLRIKGRVIAHQPMKDLTSLKIGGRADLLVIPEDLEDIKSTLFFCRERGIPFFSIGNGTNLLVQDEGFRGVIIKLGSSFNRIENQGEEIKVGAGTNLSDLIDFAIQRGLTGLESLAGIPGTVGGAVVRNVSAFGESFSQRVLSVKVLTNNNDDLVLSKEDIEFGYRTSIFLRKKDWLITEVKLRLSPGIKEKIIFRLKKIKKKRALTQPLFLPSAGCIFKNPPSCSAGSLIQKAGCMGMSIGDAQISFQHANFIVNRGKASAEDVLRLMQRVQDKVKDKFGIILEPELEIV